TPLWTSCSAKRHCTSGFGASTQWGTTPPLRSTSTACGKRSSRTPPTPGTSGQSGGRGTGSDLEGAFAMFWILFALGSAFFAGITAVLAKICIEQVGSTLATALRTVVVLAFSWLMVFVAGS